MPGAPMRTRPSGSMATIVGGLIGAAAGALAGTPVANVLASSGLEGIGTALLIVFVALSLGATVGVWVALAVRGHSRPLPTALLAMPAIFLAAIVILNISVFLRADGLFSSILLLVIASVSLWLARALAMVGGTRPDPVEITEE